jgi:hypothetical protein
MLPLEPPLDACLRQKYEASRWSSDGVMSGDWWAQLRHNLIAPACQMRVSGTGGERCENGLMIAAIPVVRLLRCMADLMAWLSVATACARTFQWSKCDSLQYV